MTEIDILVPSKNRVAEICVMMQSLRTQTFKNWNLFILDNCSQVSYASNHLFNVIVSRLRLEGHKVKLLRNEIDYGNCFNRNRLNEIQLKEGTGNLSMRLDDDILVEPDYIERLLKVIESGYDIASGVTPLCGMPEWEREVKVLDGEINKTRFDEDGNILVFGDDCGYSYIESKIFPAGHFRSCALYKSEINGKVRYPDNLSKYGFREESFFSLKCRILGYKIGVDTGAKVYHIQTPSGGSREITNNESIGMDDATFRKWVKKRFKEIK